MPDVEMDEDFLEPLRILSQEITEPLPIYLRAAITPKDLAALQGERANLQGELALAQERLKRAEAENAAMRQQLGRFPAFESIYPRAWKMMLKTKFFLAVAIDEPYFPGVYALIRAREMEIGRWSEYDQAMMVEALSEHAHLGVG